MIRHLSESLYRELDFRQEAANIARLGEVLKPYSRLKVPDFIPQISTSRLLVLDFIDGVNIRESPHVPERRAAARQLIESYYRQILIDGFFHADPHPGNLLWSDGNVYFLDCGMVGELDARLREQMMLLVTAFWQGDDAFVAEIVLSLSGGDKWPDIDLEQFELEISHLFAGVRGQSLQEIELGPLMQSITQVAARHDIRLPAALALTGKALAQMQLAATTLDPELDPLSVVGPFVLKMLAERVRHAADPTHVFYEGQKAILRFRRFIQAAERMAGARPGRRLEIDLPAIRRWRRRSGGRCDGSSSPPGRRRRSWPRARRLDEERAGLARDVVRDRRRGVQRFADPRLLLAAQRWSRLVAAAALERAQHAALDQEGEDGHHHPQQPALQPRANLLTRRPRARPGPADEQLVLLADDRRRDRLSDSFRRHQPLDVVHVRDLLAVQRDDQVLGRRPPSAAGLPSTTSTTSTPLRRPSRPRGAAAAAASRRRDRCRRGGRALRSSARRRCRGSSG